LFAVSFDTNSGLTDEMLENGLIRCIERKEVLMLYTYTTFINSEKGFHFNIEILKKS